MGAHPRRPRADARHTARLHHARDAVHRVGARTDRRDAARAALRHPQRHPPGLGRRVDERRRDRPAHRPHREGGARRRGPDRARVQRQPGAHRPLLRHARAGDRREPGRRRAEPEGPRRSAHARARADARPGPARGRSFAAARGALPLHGDDGAARVPRGRAARCVVRVHRRAAARQRHVAAVGRADDREPAGSRLRRRHRRGRARGDVGLLHDARRRGSDDRSACRSSTTSRSTRTSFRAA